MIRGTLHAELAPYDLSHAAAGPQFRREAGGERTEQQHLARPFPLRAVELRLGPDLRLRPQSLVATLSMSLLPTLHARQAHA